MVIRLLPECPSKGKSTTSWGSSRSPSFFLLLSFLLLLPPVHSLIYPPIIHPPIFLSILRVSCVPLNWANCWEGKVENNTVFPLRISPSWMMTSPFLNHFYCWKVLFFLGLTQKQLPFEPLSNRPYFSNYFLQSKLSILSFYVTAFIILKTSWCFLISPFGKSISLKKTS